MTDVASVVDIGISWNIPSNKGYKILISFCMKVYQLVLFCNLHEDLF